MIHIEILPVDLEFAEFKERTFDFKELKQSNFGDQPATRLGRIAGFASESVFARLAGGKVEPRNKKWDVYDKNGRIWQIKSGLLKHPPPITNDPERMYRWHLMKECLPVDRCAWMRVITIGDGDAKKLTKDIYLIGWATAAMMTEERLRLPHQKPTYKNLKSYTHPMYEFRDDELKTFDKSKPQQ